MKTHFTILLASCTTITLSACNTDPNANLMTMSRTQQGAIAGVAAGALFGALRDKDGNNKGKDVLKGAIVGAMIGAGAGAILDQQAKALQSQISDPNVRVVNNGQYLTVVMPESILFATNSTAVSGSAKNDLYAVARNLNQYTNSRIEVIGHTDNTGSADYNIDLSQRRAQSVAGILEAAGVAPYRVVTIGRGESMPVATNLTAAGRAQNRRVEIIIRPTK